MIPLKDYNPTKRFPLFTVLLILLNGLVFLADILSGGLHEIVVPTPAGAMRVVDFIGGLTARYALIPAHVTSNFSMEWPTVFSSMFLHGNWLHLGSNMLYLWIFGNNIEDSLGRFRFLLFYFVCGMAAAALQIVAAPNSHTPMIGASGAVAGVMGAYILLYPNARVLTLIPLIIFFPLVELPAYFIIGYWAFLQFISSAFMGGGETEGGGIAYLAHVGGFLAGLLLVFPLGGRRR